MQCGICVGPCECEVAEGALMPLNEEGRRWLFDHYTSLLREREVAEYEAGSVYVERMAEVRCTQRGCSLRITGVDEAAKSIIFSDAPTAPYAEGDLDALLAAFHGEDA